MIFLDHSLLFLFLHIFFYFFLIFIYIFNIYYIIFLLSYLYFCDFCILSDMICCILFKRSFLIYTFVCTKVKKSLQNIILQRLFLFFLRKFFHLDFLSKNKKSLIFIPYIPHHILQSIHESWMKILYSVPETEVQHEDFLLKYPYIQLDRFLCQNHNIKYRLHLSILLVR